jgi:cobalamin-dependent methionine synthase I
MCVVGAVLVTGLVLVLSIKDEKGKVRIVNPMTAVMRKIAATDTLVVATDGAGTTLERKRGRARGRRHERIGYFVCPVDDVVVFVGVVAKAAGCAFERPS